MFARVKEIFPIKDFFPVVPTSFQKEVLFFQKELPLEQLLSIQYIYEQIKVVYPVFLKLVLRHCISISFLLYMKKFSIY